MPNTKPLASQSRYPGPGALATRTVDDKLREVVSVKDFGAVGDGVADETAAFAAAITYLKNRGGGKVLIPHGSYLLNGVAGADGVVVGIQLPYVGGSDSGATSTSVDLLGEDRDVNLLAGTNGMTVVRCSLSYGEVGTFSVFANGKTGVTAVALVPENTTSPVTYSQQSHNNIHDIYTYQCAEGLVLQCGGSGGCHYNNIRNMHIHGGYTGGTRGVFLKNGVGPGSPSNVNRNQFYSILVTGTNTGFHIESGSGNSFFGCSTEGIQAGTSPLATPTAIYIPYVDAYGKENNINEFFGFMSEACTRDLVCLNPEVSFFGFSLDATKSTLASNFVSKQAGQMIGSYDTSVFPNIYGGTLEYGNNLPSGLSGTFEYGAVNTQVNRFDIGHKYKAVSLSTSNVVGVNSLSPQVAAYYSQFAGMVDYSFRFMFNPTSSTVVIKVPLPVVANQNALWLYGTIAPMRFPIVMNNGTELMGFGRIDYTNGNTLEIYLPSGQTWNTIAGQNNAIYGSIRYRANV